MSKDTVSENKSLNKKKSLKKKKPKSFYEQFTEARKSDENWRVMGGSYVWIPDEKHGCIVGSVLGREDKDFIVELEDGSKRKLQIEQIHPINPPKNDYCEDLVELYHLNESTVFYNLRQRFLKDWIYTWCGNSLVSINPFKNLQEMHSPQMMANYSGKKREDLEPHIYALAESAFRAMKKTGQSQSILLTGLSGSGKTTNVNEIIQYLTTNYSSDESIGKKIIKARKLLQDFGSCKTIVNNNASRDVNFITLDFDQNAQIIGGRLTAYLIDRSRITHPPVDERNYHIFYFVGKHPEMKKRFCIEDIDTYKYIKRGLINVEGINDEFQFSETMEEMRTLGFKEKEMESVFQVVAAILHLGNVQISETDDGVLQIADKKGIVINYISHPNSALGHASTLLGVKPDKLEQTILKPENQEKVTLAQAKQYRDTLAKSIYTRLYNWVVKRINQAIAAKDEIASSIAMLDIPGFEKLDNNSIEQFNINRISEVFNQYANEITFKKEQQIYIEESIGWTPIEMGSDAHTIVSLQKEIGNILDAHTGKTDSSPKTFMKELAERLKDNKKFSIVDDLNFSIDHQFEKIIYNTSAWLRKNQPSLLNVELANSSIEFIKGLFDQKVSPSTINSQFITDTNTLLKIIDTMEPHYVRCFLPNKFQQRGLFDPQLIFQQLRETSIEDKVRIARKGFPTKIPHEAFVKRYFMLAEPGDLEPDETPRDHCKDILRNVHFRSGKQYKLGKSLVLLKVGQESILEELRALRIFKLIVFVQSLIRGNLVRQRQRDRKSPRKRQARFFAALLAQRNSRPDLAYSALSNARQENAQLKAKIKELEEMLEKQKDVKNAEHSENSEVDAMRETIRKLTETNEQLVQQKEVLESRVKKLEQELANLKSKQVENGSKDTLVDSPVNLDENKDESLN